MSSPVSTLSVHLTFSISSCVRAEGKALIGCVCNLDLGRGIDVGSHLIHENHCVSAIGSKYSKRRGALKKKIIPLVCYGMLNSQVSIYLPKHLY